MGSGIHSQEQVMGSALGPAYFRLCYQCFQLCHRNGAPSNGDDWVGGVVTGVVCVDAAGVGVGTAGGITIAVPISKKLWPNCGRRKPIPSVTLDQPSVTKRETPQNPRWLFNCY